MRKVHGRADEGTKAALEEVVSGIRLCTRCPRMHRPGVSGGAVLSRVMTVGQAPGSKEPVVGRPFAWTAGKTLFRWFTESCGWSEDDFRRNIYMAAVCRCFPGKTSVGGDRVPAPDEIENCRDWLDTEIALLRPKLVIPIGKLAIHQFLAAAPLAEVVGGVFPVTWKGVKFDVIPLPHPSGASPWHRMEPGKTLLRRALSKIVNHPAWPPRFDHSHT